MQFSIHMMNSWSSSYGAIEPSGLLYAKSLNWKAIIASLNLMHHRTLTQKSIYLTSERIIFWPFNVRLKKVYKSDKIRSRNFRHNKFRKIDENKFRYAFMLYNDFSKVFVALTQRIIDLSHWTPGMLGVCRSQSISVFLSEVLSYETPKTVENERIATWCFRALNSGLCNVSAMLVIYNVINWCNMLGNIMWT